MGNSLGLPINQVIVDSFQEYEGEHALVLFSQGCNLDCSFCYNKNLIGKDQVIGYSHQLLMEHLTPLHTAIVFLGGEPTIWEQLSDEIIYVKKELGLKTKLYTNGILIKSVLSALDENALDAVSVDLKATKNVRSIINQPFSDILYLELFSATVRMFLARKLDVEVRTTKAIGVDFEATTSFMEEQFPGVRYILQDEMTM